jgi:hypothetical protein
MPHANFSTNPPPRTAGIQTPGYWHGEQVSRKPYAKQAGPVLYSKLPRELWTHMPLPVLNAAPALAYTERTFHAVVDQEVPSPRQQTSGEPTFDQLRKPQHHPTPRLHIASHPTRSGPMRCIECAERGVRVLESESPRGCALCAPSLSTQRMVQETISSAASCVKGAVSSFGGEALAKGAMLFPIWSRLLFFPSYSRSNLSRVLPQQRLRPRATRQRGHAGCLTGSSNNMGAQPCLASPVNLTGIAIVALVFIALSVLVDEFEGAAGGIGLQADTASSMSTAPTWTQLPRHMLNPFESQAALTSPPQLPPTGAQVMADWTTANELTCLTIGMFCVVTIWALVAYVKLIGKGRLQFKHLD